MSFELIDNIDEKYPEEHFTRESVYKVNLKEIVDKIRTVIINAKGLIADLVLRIDDLESRIQALE